jgi:dynein heavy chain 1
VNVWIKEVQTVTKLTRDVASGTASQEINFWLSMDKALEATAVQLAADEVQLALEILKNAKRFHATMSFFSDTGLKASQDTGENDKRRVLPQSLISNHFAVHKYNQLMKDFPLNELLSATDLDKIKESLYLIFSHINKKLKVS